MSEKSEWVEVMEEGLKKWSPESEESFEKDKGMKRVGEKQKRTTSKW